MKSSFSFGLGLAAGIGLSAVTAFAATRLWTDDDVKQANSIFAHRSGVSFTLTTPENGAKQQTLGAHFKPFDGLIQHIAVNPGDPSIPPGPCFTAKVQPPPDPETPGVTLQVLEPDAVILLDADGNRATLCPAGS